MLSFALRRINPTSVALNPAQKAGGAALPLRHVLLHKWWQVTPLQETQVMVQSRLTTQRSLGEERCGPGIVRRLEK